MRRILHCGGGIQALDGMWKLGFMFEGLDMSWACLIFDNILAGDNFPSGVLGFGRWMESTEARNGVV